MKPAGPAPAAQEAPAERLPAPLWATASFGDSPGTRPAELEALREHLWQCSRRSGHLVALQCGWLGLCRFMVSRLVTTLAVLTLGLAVAWLMLV